MSEKNADAVLENLLSIMPVFHKKVARLGRGIADDLAPPHMAILGMLSRHSLTATQLADRLAAKKPQMTFLVEQLVQMGLVERTPNTKDRRVVNLSLSEHGRARFNEIKIKVRENVREKLGALTPEDIEKVSAALETLKGIIAKL
jgi:DNA-binding MarR family transcriptional regulator